MLKGALFLVWQNIKRLSSPIVSFRRHFRLGGSFFKNVFTKNDKITCNANGKMQINYGCLHLSSNC